MPSAAALRLQIETELGTRIPGALTPRPRVVRDLNPTGIPELDTLLEGGLPIGAITELVGPQSSGRTTLALATLAELTQTAKTVAWVDASDSLDPESAAAAGVDLARNLWVRCGQSSQAPAQPQPTRTTTPAFLTETGHAPATSGGCGSPHPRGEVRGLSNAVGSFLHPDVFSRPAPPRDPAVPRRDKTIGTPGAPNRKLLPAKSLDRTPHDPRPIYRRAKDREEQIPSDRQPSRRQIHHACSDPEPRNRSLQATQIANTAAAAARNRPPSGHWKDNTNNVHGRALQTPPNAIAAGLPRFRDLEARANTPQPQNRVPQVSILRPGFAELPGASPSQVVPGPPSSTLNREELPKAGPQSTKPKTSSLAGERPPNLPKTASPLWSALDQALRATDLLLAAGGFSAVVLDLGSTPPEFAWRIPLATWFRFRAAADRARTILIVLTQHPCARSSAELVLRLSPAEPEATPTVLTSAHFRVTLDRRRFESVPQPTPAATPTQPNKLHLVPIRKPPQREATWRRSAAWTGTQPVPTRGTP